MRLTQHSSRALTASAILLCAVAAIGSAGAASAADIYMSGTLKLSTITLAKDDRIIAIGDLHIICHDDIVIEGSIEAAPGVSLKIEASQIRLPGSVRTADIAPSRGVNETGGDAGDIDFITKKLDVRGGRVVAGNGGGGGPSGDGGRGGAVRVQGGAPVLKDNSTFVKSGDGGAGGDAGEGTMDGGDGGSPGALVGF